MDVGRLDWIGAIVGPLAMVVALFLVSGLRRAAWHVAVVREGAAGTSKRSRDFDAGRADEHTGDVFVSPSRGATAVRSAALVVAAAIVAAPFDSPARACNVVCIAGKEPSARQKRAALRDGLEGARIVFLGRVVSIASETGTDLPPEYANRIATLEVLAEWKGPGSSTYHMVTACCSASCGYPFRVGQLHLLLLQRDGEQMSATGCPDPTKKALRDSIRMLDEVSGRRTLLPPELR